MWDTKSVFEEQRSGNENREIENGWSSSPEIGHNYFAALKKEAIELNWAFYILRFLRQCFTIRYTSVPSILEPWVQLVSWERLLWSWFWAGAHGTPWTCHDKWRLWSLRKWHRHKTGPHPPLVSNQFLLSSLGNIPFPSHHHANQVHPCSWRHHCRRL